MLPWRPTLRGMMIGLCACVGLAEGLFASPTVLAEAPTQAALDELAKLPRGAAATAEVATWLTATSDVELDAYVTAPYADAATMLAAVFRHGGKAELARVWSALVATQRPERSALMQRAARSAGANPAAQAVLLTMMLGDDLAAAAQASSYLAEQIEPYAAWPADAVDTLAARALALRASKARGVAVAILAGQCAHAPARRVAAEALAGDRLPTVRAAAVAVVECDARAKQTSVPLALLAVAARGDIIIEVRMAAIARLAATVAVAPMTVADRTALLAQFSRWRHAAAGSDHALGLALALLEVMAGDAHADTQRVLIATLGEQWPPPLVGAAIAAMDNQAPACPPAARVPLIRLAQSPYAELATPASRAVARCFPSR